MACLIGGIVGSLGGPARYPARLRGSYYCCRWYVNGAKLTLGLMVKPLLLPASATSHSFTDLTAVKSGDVIYVVQTESGKVPTESAKVTV